MAGFGSRISPVFLYKHNSNLTKNLGLGVGIKHYSSWLDIKDLGPSAFMNNAFDIGLTSTGSSNLQIGGIGRVIQAEGPEFGFDNMLF